MVSSLCLASVFSCTTNGVLWWRVHERVKSIWIHWLWPLKCLANKILFWWQKPRPRLCSNKRCRTISVYSDWPILTVEHLQFLKCFLYEEKIIPAVDLQSADAMIAHCFHPSVAVHLRACVRKRTNSPSYQVLVFIARFTSASKSVDGQRSWGPRSATLGWCHRKAPPRGRDKAVSCLVKHRKLSGGKFTTFWGCLSPPSRRHSGSSMRKTRSHTFVISLNELALFSPPPPLPPPRLGSLGCDMSADLIMKQQERGVSSRRKHRGKIGNKWGKKSTAGDATAMIVWPAINILLHHCS